MSKELELIRLLINGANEYEKETGNKNPTVYLSRNNLLVIEQSLQRLESIDNAEPSEALECLEDIYRNGVFISKVSFREQHPTNISPETNKSISVQCNTIKQSLLKAQEPKHYLKWEDLEFNHTPKMIDVKMNGNKYKLVVGYNVAGKNLAILRDNKKEYYFLEYDKQFFNDLHLEMVEE